MRRGSRSSLKLVSGWGKLDCFRFKFSPSPASSLSDLSHGGGEVRCSQSAMEGTMSTNKACVPIRPTNQVQAKTVGGRLCT